MIYSYIGDGDSRLVGHFVLTDSLISQVEILMKYNDIFLHFHVYEHKIYGFHFIFRLKWWKNAVVIRIFLLVISNIKKLVVIVILAIFGWGNGENGTN